MGKVPKFALHTNFYLENDAFLKKGAIIHLINIINSIQKNKKMVKVIVAI